MGFLEIIGLVTIVYYVLVLLSSCILDKNFELFFYEKFGKPISSLKGKVIWITGASSGLGKGLAIVLAKNDVKLCLSARRKDELEMVKQECLAASTSLQDKDILVLQMDMTDIANHDAYFQKVVNYFGGHLDVLVNNAGRTQRASWPDISLDIDKAMFDLNVFSVVNLSRIYVRYIHRRSLRGHIFVTSSAAALIDVSNSATYSACKFALHGYMGALKVECPDIDVTLFCPGPIMSNILQEAFTDKLGEKHGLIQKSTDRKMSTDRCAQQMAVAIANKTYISVNGSQPIFLLIMLQIKFPYLKKGIDKLLGQERLLKIRNGKS